jgi:CheY-like chemotaxis protein
MAFILVAEDDADTCEALSRFLENHGHMVKCVPNGRAAIQAAIDHLPDLIVSDLMMPEMTGINLLETLRAYLRLSRVPVIIWTGAPEGAITKRARELNISAILNKPQATLEDLRKAIDKAMYKPSAEDRPFVDLPPNDPVGPY